MHFSLTSVLAAALALASSAAALTADQQQALDIHNNSRANKGLAKLTWDNNLVNAAQECANRIAASGNFAHCGSGENLYGRSGGSGGPLAAGAQAWVDEAPNYTGQRIPDGDFGSYGHYSK